MKVFVLAALAVVAAGFESPLYMWGDAFRGLKLESGAAGFNRQAFLQRLTAMETVNIHIFYFDGLTSDMMNNLASSSRPETAGLMQTLGRHITSSSAFAAPRAKLASQTPLLAEIRNAVRQRCTVHDVEATAEAREQYLTSGGAGDRCNVYIVHASTESLEKELRFVMKATQARNTGTYILVGNAPVAAAVQESGPRFLADTSSNTPILVTPEVVVGVIIGFFLLFITAVGVQCTMSVKTPDLLHTVPLPAGKEY